MIPIVWPYKIRSASAKALAQQLETKRVYSDRNYRPRRNHVVINWGNGIPARFMGRGFAHSYLNLPGPVLAASNKIRCLHTLFGADITTPRFFTEQYQAEDILIHEPETKIFCRTLTRANSGRGIVIATTPEELVQAPLYTADVGKRREYRVHVFNGEVIDYSQKKKLTTEQLEERGIEFCKDIRSYSNGWIFARDAVDLPDPVRDVAVNAVAALGLDFAAVDCYYTSIHNPNPQVAGVFEVNTAPGLQGTTLDRYVEAIQNYLDSN